MKARHIVTVAVLMAASMLANAQEQPKAPGLEYAFTLKVKCENAFTVGKTSHGTRAVIPIVGGTFEGPNIKGTILSGGADYQLIDSVKGRNEIEAIYCIKTDDDVYIHVRNCGLIVTGKNDDGTPKFYFRCAPKFEAPNNSKYDWLNNSLFICEPGFEPGFIMLNIWRVL